MCDRFNHNRKKLTQLIYSQKSSFGKRQIISEFSKEQDGDIVIDGSQTIGQYLDELAEYGALTYEMGKYRVKT